MAWTRWKSRLAWTRWRSRRPATGQRERFGLWELAVSREAAGRGDRQRRAVGSPRCRGRGCRWRPAQPAGLRRAPPTAAEPTGTPPPGAAGSWHAGPRTPTPPACARRRGSSSWCSRRRCRRGSVRQTRCPAPAAAPAAKAAGQRAVGTLQADANTRARAPVGDERALRAAGGGLHVTVSDCEASGLFPGLKPDREREG
jgi:hypothetical protein